MAGKASVPVDLVSEQKHILGLVSYRQAAYLGGGFILTCVVGQIVMTYVGRALGTLVAVFITLLFAILFMGIALFFSFFKLFDYDMPIDQYLFFLMTEAPLEHGNWVNATEREIEDATPKVEIKEGEPSIVKTMKTFGYYDSQYT